MEKTTKFVTHGTTGDWEEDYGTDEDGCFNYPSRAEFQEEFEDIDSAVARALEWKQEGCKTIFVEEFDIETSDLVKTYNWPQMVKP